MMDENDTEEYLGSWFEYFENQASTQQTNNVLVMWGGDFAHKDASNFDTLTETIGLLEMYFALNGLGSKFKLKLSTAKQYFDAVESDAV